MSIHGKIPHEIDSGGENDSRKEELLNTAKKIVHRREAGKSKKSSKKKEKFDWGAQGALILGGTLLLMILLYGMIGMYRHQERQEGRRLTEESALPSTVRYGGEELPGKTFVGMEAVRTDRTPELVDEIKRVIGEEGMPSDVFRNDVPPEKNLAEGLSREFKIYQENSGELERLRREVPYDEWKIDKETLDRVSDVLERVEPKRQDIRSMLNQADVCFSFEFVHDPVLGELPDTEASGFLADYMLLEEFAAARALIEGKPTAATESLAYIFRLAQLASEVKNPGIRTKAAQIRLHGLDIMQAVVLDPNFRRSDLVYLYTMLREQLDAWTPDVAAWIGDRASGMKVYNMVIQYGVDDALEPDEIEEMSRRNLVTLNMKGKWVLNDYGSLGRDQVFYLKSMQEVIDSCQKPFPQRLPVLNRITDRVRAAQGTEAETVIAEFLLRGIRELMQYCAQDRVKCETAVLAMATSLKDTAAPAERASIEKTLQTLTLDPLYGKKYEVRRIPNDREPKIDVVWVSYFGNLKPFRVPDYGGNGMKSEKDR